MLSPLHLSHQTSLGVFVCCNKSSLPGIWRICIIFFQTFSVSVRHQETRGKVSSCVRPSWGRSISPGPTPRIPQEIQATEMLQVPSPLLCQSSLLPSCCSCRNEGVVEQRSCRISMQWTLPTPQAPGRQEPNQRPASSGCMEILQGKSTCGGGGRKTVGRVLGGFNLKWV